MKITLDFLASRNACYGGRENFLVLFGTEVEFNKENIIKYIKSEKYAFQDFRWLASYLLNGDNYEEFFKSYYNFNLKFQNVDNYSLELGMKIVELLEKQNVHSSKS